jgi:hypothetical protein
MKSGRPMTFVVLGAFCGVLGIYALSTYLHADSEVGSLLDAYDSVAAVDAAEHRVWDDHEEQIQKLDQGTDKEVGDLHDRTQLAVDTLRQTRAVLVGQYNEIASRTEVGVIKANRLPYEIPGGPWRMPSREVLFRVEDPMWPVWSDEFARVVHE